MRIAVIGTGVSGLVAARQLDTHHDVTVFEAQDRLGGHTNTVVVEEAGRPIPIDTGFIVFNTETYPRFVALLQSLGVAWAPSDMSFSVRSEQRDFEYASQTIGSLFAQKQNALRPRFWRMLRDLFRFFREAHELSTADTELALGDWLDARRYSQAFVEDHLIPMTRAVWSADEATARTFPARFLARFFKNHGFLQAYGRVPWLTIPGGAHSYVRAIQAAFSGTIRTEARVERLRRTNDGIAVATEAGGWELFDHVVVACHADQALRLLDAPTPAEQRLLGAFPFQANHAVLHTDARLMPRRRPAWASWNAHLDADTTGGAAVTYWMNRLQPLGAQRDYFVTLNHTGAIRDEHVLMEKSYAHPLFTIEGIHAQTEHDTLIDHHGVSYCGAYWRNGFHEDGVQSAEKVVRALSSERRGVLAA